MTRQPANRYAQAEVRGRLAAEYALGTLRGRARARFEKLLRGDVTLREEVTFWQERFSDFARRLKPVAPRAVVWAALEQTIAGDAGKVSQLHIPRATITSSSPRKLVWQVWAAAATVAAAALGLNLQQERAKTEALHAALETAQNQPAPYVAVLQPAGGDARWAITLHPDQNLMRVVLSGGKMPVDTSQRSLQLWLLDSKGKPHSLGLLPVSGGGARDLPLIDIPAEEKGAALTLAISEEPRGGSPTGLPTGKVLGAVPAVKPI